MRGCARSVQTRAALGEYEDFRMQKEVDKFFKNEKTLGSYACQDSSIHHPASFTCTSIDYPTRQSPKRAIHAVHRSQASQAAGPTFHAPEKSPSTVILGSAYGPFAFIPPATSSIDNSTPIHIRRLLLSSVLILSPNSPLCHLCSQPSPSVCHAALATVRRCAEASLSRDPQAATPESPATSPHLTSPRIAAASHHSTAQQWTTPPVAAERHSSASSTTSNVTSATTKTVSSTAHPAAA